MNTKLFVLLSSLLFNSQLQASNTNVEDVLATSDGKGNLALVVTGNFNYCQDLKEPKIEYDHFGKIISLTLEDEEDCLLQPYHFPYHFVTLDQFLLGEYRVKVFDEQGFVMEKDVDFDLYWDIGTPEYSSAELMESQSAEYALASNN